MQAGGLRTGLSISAGADMKALIAAAMAVLAASCGAVKTEPQTLRLYANAHALYSGGQFTQCAALLEGVKGFPPALTLRAKAHYFAGDYGRAEQSCKQAIRLRPGNFEAKLYLARIMRDRGESAKAMRMAEDLLADNPADIRLLRLAASIAMEHGDAAGASLFLDQAADHTAEGAMVLLDRARFRWIAGKGNEALEDLARARAMLPWETPAARSINQLENRITEAMR